jgi:hypothetical protein
LIDWNATAISEPPTDKQIIFRVKGEKFVRAGEFSKGNEDFPHSGYEDMSGAEFFRAKRVSHLATVNFPK